MQVPIPPDERERLRALERYAVLDTPPEANFDRITALAARLFDVPIALVTLIDADRQWFKSCVGMDIDAPDSPRDTAFCAHAILQPTALIVPDTLQDPRFRDNPLVTGEPHVRFYAGAPLVTAGGHRLGSLCVIDTVPREVDAGKIATLHDLAAVVIEALDARLANQQLEEQMREVARRTRQLEAANAELDAFSSSVSHDLRAPLRHISGFASLLEEQAVGKLDTEDQGCLRSIRRAAERMGRMIDDLLTLSRTGRTEMRAGPVDLKKLFEREREEFNGETKARRVIWTIGDLPTVTGDESLLRQVAANLLSNAVKYTRPRDPAEIEVGWRREEESGAVVVYVRDNGVGYDANYAGKLFGVFERLHPASEFEGTGVGLANVRRIIQRHGGRTWAEGEVGKGATVFFSLPG